MMMSTMLSLAAACAALAQSASLTVEREPGRAYEPFSGRGADARLRVELTDAPEGARLVAVPSAGAPLALISPNGARLPYRFAAEDLRAGGTEDRIDVPLTPNPQGEAAVTLRLVVDAGPVVPPGQYEALLDLTVLDAEGRVRSELLAVATRIAVPARAQAVLAGTSGAFDPQSTVAFVDFGTLQTGDQRRLFVTLRANTEAAITVTSRHGGVMRLEDAAPEDTRPGTSITYAVDLDGEAARLTAPLTIRRAPRPTLAGTAYPMTITLGDASGLFAGTYRDEITIAVTPQ